jgi:hypothetical protein
MQPIEIWKDIPEYKGIYQVSNLGRVKRLQTSQNRSNNKILNLKEKLLNGTINYFGYNRVTLYKNCIGKSCAVHRLVAICFIENKLNKPQVNHIDGNKLNNIVENLEWCNNSENQLHAWKLGLNRTSDNLDLYRTNCIVTKELVIKIREELKTTKSRILAKKYNLSESQMSNIKNNKRWKAI